MSYTEDIGVARSSGRIMSFTEDIGLVRSRTLTEKGRENQLEMLEQRRRKIVVRLQRQRKMMQSLMESGENVELMEDEVVTLNEIFRDLLAANTRHEVLLSDEQLEAAETWMDEQDRTMVEFKEAVHKWLKDARENLDRKSVVSQTSRASKKSVLSHGSRRSLGSARDAIFEEKARVAELKVEADYIEKKRNAETLAEQLKVENEIRKSEARMKILEEEFGNPYDDYMHRENVEKAATKQAADHSLINLRQNSEHTSKGRMQFPTDESSTQLIARFLRQQSAPEVDLDVFNGDPLEFRYFMATFEESIETKIEEPRGRLTRLLKYVGGEAKQLIKHCIHESPSEGYNNAKKLLQERFGDPYTIFAAYKKELIELPSVKSGDATAFRKFYGYLVKYKCILAAGSSSMIELNSPEVIKTLQSKLPIHLQDRWNRRAFEHRRKHLKLADFDEFLKFVDQETKLANDPMYSREAMGFSYQNKQRQDSRNGRIKSFSTGVNESQCPICLKKHLLEKCYTFLKLDVDDRRKALFKHRRCFACLGTGHVAGKCTQKVKCDVCHQMHPTVLHGIKRKTEENDLGFKKDLETDETRPVVNSCTGTSCYSNNLNQFYSLSVVPVKLHHVENPEKKIVTYALLDNCSQGTFVTQSILEELCVVGEETLLTIKTMSGEETEKHSVITNLVASPYFATDGDVNVPLPKAYSRMKLPVDRCEIPSKSTLKKWKYLDPIQQYILDDPNHDVSVGLLIGINAPKCLEPKDVISSQQNGPYAVRTNLGWCVTGPLMKNTQKSSLWCNRIVTNENAFELSCQLGIEKEVEDVMIKRLILSIYESDFNEPKIRLKNQLLTENGVTLSLNDRKFLDIMDGRGTLENGHYVLPLPFRTDNVKMPNNRHQAVQRALGLKRRFHKDAKLFEDYKTFMEQLVSNGYAKRAYDEPENGKCWYIPHHAVYHPQKPGKIRVVFDCSAELHGASLNKSLLAGPDLTNQLVGVFTRFRKENVAIMADIEKMFYQVRVPDEQQDYLRYVWWVNSDLKNPLIDYKMCVHLFGGASLPSCSNYALRRTADDNESVLGIDAAETLRKNFYVDDMLKSVKDDDTAIQLISNVKKMCQAGGFNLTKFISNSRNVLEKIELTDRANSLKVDLTMNHLPSERALGIYWLIENDCLSFRITLKDKPLTRRGILSSISSIYDPLGMAAPFLLPGKQLLQQICNEKKDWDDEVTSKQRHVWEKWRNDLPMLESIEVPRCFKPSEFGDLTEASLHHFSDASLGGYGQASYLRLVNKDGEISTSLVMGKSRVTPLKQISIPRLELTAAVVAVKVSCMLRRELDMENLKEWYWTDSQVVLAYIRNETKRFHTFVANRVQLIRENSNVKQWRYVKSQENPADDASRGLQTSHVQKSKRWFFGPSFLKQEMDLNKKPIEEYAIPVDDREVKHKISVNAVKINDILSTLESRFSDWFKMRRVVATMLMWRDPKKEITLENLQRAEMIILKLVQEKAFQKELTSKVISSRENSLYRLDPFLDKNGIIRVGGRLSLRNDDYDIIHPVILPRHSITTNLVILWYHRQTQHAGRGSTLNALRSAGYWIINGNSVVRYLIDKCVTCRRLRGKLSVQKMSDLPVDRVTEAPPFTYCGVDMFGPFHIKDGRRLLKRYGAIFTCMASRAVHVESTNKMDADSFIQALRRMISRRGNVRQIRCDHGSNFIGAESELCKALHKMDHEKVKRFLQSTGADYLIEWKRNPPTSSHMGGSWERQIRSIRAVLSHLFKHHGESLDDESFRTFLTEAEAIINSRPLTLETINDPLSERPITPNHLLTMKSKVIMPPPGVFLREDLYSRRRWRRVQHLLNEFWSRWKKTYLSSLQMRSKWNERKRQFQPGDVVMVKDAEERGNWPMGKILSIMPSVDGNVRKVVVRLNNSKYERPIHKLVLLLEASNDSPDEEP